MLILHGEHQVASRDQLTALRRASLQPIEFSGSDLDPDRLIPACESKSLFGQTASVFIENLFSSRTGAAKKQIAGYLRDHPDFDVTVWEPKDVSSQLKDFPPQVVRRFDLPRHIFKFLDHPSLTTLHLALSVTPSEVVFASLVTRLHKQIASGNLQTLSRYQQLLDIDYKLKTSALPYDLATALELWLLKP